LISIGIFNFLGQWNQYMLPYVLNQGEEKDKLLPQGLVELAVSQGYKGNWAVLFSGLLIAMIPVLAVYIIFQRQVQAGLTAGALK
ncbi:carbohydrate ABC transporter permease, partial [Streptomyces buecherae]